jgi:hypothetical protein
MQVRTVRRHKAFPGPLGEEGDVADRTRVRADHQLATKCVPHILRWTEKVRARRVPSGG